MDRGGRLIVDKVLETANQLRTAIPECTSHILVTKIMLGVFGCVPAFDSNVKKGQDNRRRFNLSGQEPRRGNRPQGQCTTTTTR